MNVVIHPRVMNRFEKKFCDGSSCHDAGSLHIWTTHSFISQSKPSRTPFFYNIRGPLLNWTKQRFTNFKERVTVECCYVVLGEFADFRCFLLHPSSFFKVNEILNQVFHALNENWLMTGFPELLSLWYSSSERYSESHVYRNLDRYPYEIALS